MAFDRDKYRAVPLGTVSQVQNETKQFRTFFDEKGDYAPFFKNREGIVMKRVLPAHEPGDSPYVPMYTTQLEVEVDKKDDKGNVIGKELKRKKIFLATLHGGYKFDPVEEYIRRVYELADEIQDKDERSKFLNPVTGYRMGKQWVAGIRPTLEYVYYAYIEGKIYRDSLKPKQLEALNRESAALCTANNTAAIDMFSDPSLGFPIQWDRSKDDNGKTVETLKAGSPVMHQSWEDFFSKWEISDAVLKELEGYPSLKSLYVDSYRKKDFDYALEGLKRFDEKNAYKIFSQEDFLDMIEALSTEVEKKAPKEEEPKKESPKATEQPKPAAAAPAPKKALPKKPAAPAGPTPEEKLAVVNKEFVDQYGSDYEPLELEGEELEEAYALAVAHKDLGYDIDHVPGWVEGGAAPKKPAAKRVVASVTTAPAPAEEPEPENEPEEAAAPEGINPPADAGSESGMSAIERIRALRAQRAGGKK